MAEYGAVGAVRPSAEADVLHLSSGFQTCAPRLDAEAAGWKLMVHFSGCRQWCPGEVLTYNSSTSRHHIGYDDGEDEWLDLAVEPVLWLQPPGAGPFCAALPAGAASELACMLVPCFSLESPLKCRGNACRSHLLIVSSAVLASTCRLARLL